MITVAQFDSKSKQPKIAILKDVSGVALQDKQASRKEKLRSMATTRPSPSSFPREYYVCAADAAKFLSIHPRTLLQLARKGSVPAHPLGDGSRRVWRFLLSELDEWMRNRVHSRCRPCSPKRREI
jgi:excisionase family DNA binding protein